MQGLKRLEVIQELSRNRKEWKHKELFRLIRKQDIWIAAYKSITRQKKIVLKKEHVRLSYKNLVKIENLKASVLNETYEFNDSIFQSKSNINNRNGNKYTFDDCLVSEVLKIILEAIYKPCLKKQSEFSFYDKGVHEVLEYIESSFDLNNWIIKLNEKNSLPFININKMYTLLTKKINDKRFLNLIQKFLKSGLFIDYHNFYKNFEINHVVNLYSILLNIYFHELDQFIIKEKNFLFIRDPFFHTFPYIKHYTKLQFDLTNQKKLDVGFLQPRFKIQYARYMENWIIGVSSSRNFAEIIKKKLILFFEENLEIDVKSDKIQIINMSRKKIFFLGYDILMSKTIGKEKSKLIKNSNVYSIKFQLPLEKIIKMLNKNGYITYKKHIIRPISKSNLVVFEDYQIINHFNKLWSSILTFYSGLTNWSNLQYIQYLLYISCAMTLGHRHRLSSNQVLKKYGKRLKIIDKTYSSPKTIAIFLYHKKWKSKRREWQKRE